MKTRSNRCREKAEGELLENGKKKAVFKGIQIALSVLLNTTIFYVMKENFLSDDMFIQILQVFVAVIVSVMGSNFLALAIVSFYFKSWNVKAFLSMENSYAKFFMMSLVYSFVTAICFSFGVFTILYAAYGDGTTISLMLSYALFYFVVEFFSYGIVTWAFNLSRDLKKQHGG